MKLFSWVQNKLNGRQQASKNKTNIHPSNKNQNLQLGGQKEEFSDWPQGFLSIGTLGNKDLKEEYKEHNNNLQEKSPSSQNHIQHLTSEQLGELQKDLNALLSKDDLDHYCLLSLGAEKENNNKEIQNEEESDRHFTNLIVPNSKAKDVFLDNNISNASINKTSLYLLLKKIFISEGGIGPAPSFKDPILLPPKSRLGKFLKAILHKKVYPQSTSPNMSKKKFLDSRHTTSLDNSDDEKDEEEIQSEGNNGSKWVKTDTEYIVLEI